MLDARTGRPVEVPPAGRRGLRLRVRLDCPGRRAGWQELRVLLVADVLLRTVEAAGTQVFPTMAVPELPPDRAEALDRALHGYGIHVPAAEDSPATDVHLRSGGPAPDSRSGVDLLVGRVTVGTGVPDAMAFEPTEDPLARRLALLRTPYQEAARIDLDVLRDSAAELAGWRVLVAAWSRAPSAPVPPALREQVRAALDTGPATHDLPALLRLTALDPDLEDGARFEAFLWLDRILALELARDVGRH
ncbi:hypothetical protein ABH931_007063 [Streptacidiphilus sp. MAP12-33]|uniref:hypothetical protein n=1 Tax=Streptacidiphilus sp. MAP12-33 TaxID=3156266 RepID=UPI003515EC04